MSSRTMDGFRTLIQKEYVAFGHMCRKRLGTVAHADQRSPCLLQFFECVHHIRSQVPSEFEFNDQFTRSEFTAIVEPLLREIQAKRGIQDFRVQCDENNNTPEVIDRNELVATIFIKPARSINFITLNFVATRTGLNFEEVIQRNF